MISSLLALGVLGAAFVVGRCVLGNRLAPCLRSSAIARVVLAFALGVGLLTPVLVLLAAFGLFRPAWVGGAGWIIALFGHVACHRRDTLRTASVRSVELAVLAAALVFFIVSMNGRDEAIGAGRDQQVYAEFAIALSNHGTFAARYTPLDDADKDLLRRDYRAEACDELGFHTVRQKNPEPNFVVPGGTNACDGVDKPITLLHPSGWPVWLAVAYAIGGMDGVYVANAAIFAVAGLLFFVIVRQLTGELIGMAATIVLFALPSSLWISGISLSEPLAMLLMLGMPPLAISGARFRWEIAAILLSAILVRIDSAVAVPAVVCAVLLSTAAIPTVRNVVANRRIIWAQTVSLVAAFVLYFAIYPRYFDARIVEIGTILFATAVMALLAILLTPRMATRARSLIDARAARLATISVVVLFFIYAALIRPALKPFSIFWQAGLVGMRDFREESLLNLATYMSWPLVIAALLGVCWCLWQRWASRGGLLRPMLLVIGVGFAVLYLWFPYVAPDHPWAVRRFVPVLIPYALLFAAVLAHAIGRRLGPHGPALGAFALVLPYPLLLNAYPLSPVFLRENDGLTNQVRRIAEALPNELVVADGAPTDLSASLFVAFEKPVAVADQVLQRGNGPDAIATWIDAKSKLGHPAWLLHGPELSRTGVHFSRQQEWWVTRRYVAPSTNPPATTIQVQTSEIILSRVDGLDPSFATRMFGGERVWGVREEGFFDAEVASFGTFRYTTGQAWLEVPAEALRDAEMLKLDVFTYAKAGATRWLHVLIDGRAVWTGMVGEGITTLRVPIQLTTTKSLARIELLSEPASGADLGANNPRPGLSIGLIGIRPLRRGEPQANGPGVKGFRSELALVGVPPGAQSVTNGHHSDFLLDIGNAGTQYWPCARELSTPVGAVQIALRWYPRDGTSSPISENRLPMLISLLPGDRTRIRVPLAPVGPDGSPLTAGEYELRIGMARENVAWFAEEGDATLSIPVSVKP